MTGFGDDDFFGGSAFPSSSRFADFHDHVDQYGYGDDDDAEPTYYQAPPVRQSRPRRASISTPLASAPAAASSCMTVSRTSSNDDAFFGGSAARSGGRRRDPHSGGGGSSSQPRISHVVEADHGRSHKTSERSLASTGSARRTGRRASLAAGAASLSTRHARPRADESYGAEEHYGYDYGPPPAAEHPPSADFSDLGYGDAHAEARAAPAPEAIRARRQRRCSIADVVTLTSEEAPSEAAETARPARVGAHASGIHNMAIPMTADEPKKPHRRGSIAMLGGRGKAVTKEPDVTTKKPDRDRQRQGLLDRVGAAEGRGPSRNGTTSYSDRILSK
jgi:hypothetical protein